MNKTLRTLELLIIERLNNGPGYVDLRKFRKVELGDLAAIIQEIIDRNLDQAKGGPTKVFIKTISSYGLYLWFYWEVSEGELYFTKTLGPSDEWWDIKSGNFVIKVTFGDGISMVVCDSNKIERKHYSKSVKFMRDLIHIFIKSLPTETALKAIQTTFDLY